MKTDFLKKVPALRMLGILTLLVGWLVTCSAQNATAPTGFFSTMPAGILPGSPLAQVVKLAKAGVDEGLIHAYVTNSTSTFNLDPDKIIYLKDAGVPNDLVTEMMQRDMLLQAQMTTVSAPPPATMPPPGSATPPPIDPNAPPMDPNAPPDAGNQPPPPVMFGDGSQPGDDAVPPDEPVTLNNFYDTLSPYGNWVEVDGYGRCWQPGVGVYNSEWQPYGDHGHWVYTDSGWYWDSDYAWGWAPFHYGRWFRHDRFGWCWSPDTVWGPSWVTWRYSDDYCGWAPLPPGAYYQNGVGYIYKGRQVGANFDFGLDPDKFIFVGTHDFNDPHPYRHRIGLGLNGQIYQQTAAVNGIGYSSQGFVNYGINPTRLSQINHTIVPTVSLRTTAGGTERALPSEPTFRAGGAGYVTHPPSGYLRTANGGYSVAPVTPRNYYTPPVPAQRYYAPPVFSRPEPQPQTAPEQYIRPSAPAVPVERSPVRTYTPPAAASRTTTTAQPKN
jgi:hypothetical protein